MAKKLSKKELFKLIKEAVAKKVNLLREDIDMDDEDTSALIKRKEKLKREFI